MWSRAEEGDQANLSRWCVCLSSYPASELRPGFGLGMFIKLQLYLPNLGVSLSLRLSVYAMHCIIFL